MVILYTISKMEGSLLIEVKNLVKRYGDHTAVNNISFTVEKGKIYGFLGPNGAGKSTTMNIITGCLAASEGSVTIDGHDIFEEPKIAKRLIGYLPEIPPLYGDMTPEEFLTFVAEAKKMGGGYIGSRVREVMETTGLTDMKDRLIRNLSKGYKQRVGIAQAMLGDPEIIILDEPTVGLDPKQILEIRELIRHLGETKTVILSSHILAEISAVCERVLIISHGNLVANDTIQNLEALVPASNTVTATVKGDKNAILEKLNALDGVLEVKLLKESDGTVDLEISVDKEKDMRDDIFFAMSDIRCLVVSIQYKQASLEDIFLALTDDGIIPDEKGNVPDAEIILEKTLGDKDQTEYSEMTDEELKAISEEGEDEAADSEGSPEGEDNDGDDNNDSDNDDDSGYKPLFGGN